MTTLQRRRRHSDPARLNTIQYVDAATARLLAPVAPRTFYDAITKGKLGPAFRVGGTGRLVVRREDFLRFIEATPVESKIDTIVSEVMDDLRMAK